MRTRISCLVGRSLLVALMSLSLAGCSSLHGWAQFGSNHPAQAGAGVSVPLGK